MKVVHLHKEPFDVYIGRPSKFGNPYSHQEGTLAKFKTNTREEAIQKYKEYVLKPENKDLLEEIYKLDGKILGCWCSPKKCHGDVIIELINKHKRIKLF